MLLDNISEQFIEDKHCLTHKIIVQIEVLSAFHDFSTV